MPRDKGKIPSPPIDPAVEAQQAAAVMRSSKDKSNFPNIFPNTPRPDLSRFLNAQLSGPYDEAQYGIPQAPLDIVTKSNDAPHFYSRDGLEDDPHMELAIKLMQQQHPDLFKGIRTIWVGAPLYKNILGTTMKDRASGGGASITLAHSGGDMMRAIDTLRHELSHVGGLDDNFDSNWKSGLPSAYDVGMASGFLHKDINLPPDKK